MKPSENFLSVRRLKLFRRLFVGRSDAYVLAGEGVINAVREPLENSILKAHLAGEYRVGSYVLGTDSRTRYLVFDIDEPKRGLVRKIARRLQKRGITPYVERSKSKGFHIWVFFEKRIRAKTARTFAYLILKDLDQKKIEVFPKQDVVPKGGLGNCIWLPLFKSDISRKRTVFLGENFEPEKQWALLCSINKLSKARLLASIRERSPEVVGKLAKKQVAVRRAGERIAEGKRNSTLTKIGGAMRKHGATEEAIFAALREVNQTQCDPPLPDREVQQIASSLSKYKPGKTNSEDGGSQATLLVGLAASAKLLHTPDNEAYATIQVSDHTETVCLKDPHFKRWLARLHYRKFGKVPSTHTLSDAITVLEGRAMYASRKKNVFTRLGEFKGALYLDLCDSGWKAVKITAKGWKVVSNPKVKFRRPPGMKALPIPRRGGSTQELRQFLNVPSDDSFRLMVSWIIEALNPEGPYPILVLQGEAGSAKSTTARVLRELVDPNAAPLRSAPREERDLVIAAKNSRCIAFDNLSYTSQWQSDALCRIATGSGFSTRTLYSDDHEQIFKASRPVLLNGIDGIVSRGDLMDRSIILYLPAISAEQRIPEQQFWRSFRKARPLILGALLDALVCAMKRIKSINLNWQPRMADFARWVTAAESGLGWPEGAFLCAYKSNLSSANKLVLEASPVANLLRLVCEEDSWKGTPTELLRVLDQHAGEQQQRTKGWPKTPWDLSKQLRRLASNLRAEGIDLQLDEKTPGAKSKRIFTIAISRPVRVQEGVQSSAQIRRFPRTKPWRFPRTKPRRFPRTSFSS